MRVKFENLPWFGFDNKILAIEELGDCKIFIRMFRVENYLEKLFENILINKQNHKTYIKITLTIKIPK